MLPGLTQWSPPSFGIPKYVGNVCNRESMYGLSRQMTGKRYCLGPPLRHREKTMEAQAKAKGSSPTSRAPSGRPSLSTDPPILPRPPCSEGRAALQGWWAGCHPHQRCPLSVNPAGSVWPSPHRFVSWTKCNQLSFCKKQHMTRIGVISSRNLWDDWLNDPKATLAPNEWIMT